MFDKDRRKTSFDNKDRAPTIAYVLCFNVCCTYINFKNKLK